MSRKRVLSAPERALWARIAGETEPLSGRKLPDIAPEAPPRPKRPTPPPTGDPASAPPPAISGARPHWTGLTRREIRAIRAGRLVIDGTLDLHGMTQTEAHRALTAFVLAAVARGDRYVRIITGKGRPAAHLQEGHFEPETTRGILRRRVPDWLTEPPLGSLVRGITAAGNRQGGQGALVVALKRAGGR